MVSDYETRCMELLRYASHMNMKKLEIIKFVTSLNSKFRVKVSI
jgi:hypothetical protein